MKIREEIMLFILKINFDGVVFKETEEAGLGVVVRDSHGKVLASLAEKIKLPSSLELTP